ncbi:MAG: TonB-dependent receptor [Daejeonella sp.]|uniref:TonB-dependent receptor n=1 Tax=Daejeonella sp. JGW-45 TaxID=3034148 RepID=UPI0023EE1CAA|nr:carboxypeptidase regulatory-like domain-containing protein [Daejeonella sp. JGW-45]
MKKFLLFTLVVLLGALSADAQVTTSSLTGTIRDSQETLIGATVKATHLPTGTVYGSSTGADGRFNIPNMRVGGPYTVDITYVGYKTESFSGLMLKLGEPYQLNVTMTASGRELQEVVITASDPNSVLNADRTGATTNLGRAQIASVPTISRGLNDLTKFTPQASSTNSNGPSIGGGNYRQNNFTVDGSDFNNQFGIGGNLPAGGSPISLDAIEEIAISVAPFDVRLSGFTGASINAVTRSGRNDFFGGAFLNFRNEGYQGDKVDGNRITLGSIDVRQVGASFGGPIIKNKVFFFANVERQDQVTPGSTRVAATASTPFGGTNTNVARPTAGELDAIRNYLINTYGYNPGVYQGYSNKANNYKFLARLDWNINNNHRFNIRYNQVESKSSNPTSTSTTGTGWTFPNNGGRGSIQHLGFSNSTYYQDANQYSLASELTSSFGSKVSNSLRASFTHQNDPRSSDSEVFPLVDIMKDGMAFTTFGYEPFTYGNLRDVKTTSITDNLTLNLGAHELTLGAQADFSTTQNGFQRFGTGAYRYNSWADFVNGAKPNDYAITYSLSPGYAQAFPTFKYQQYSAYLQDAFNVGEKLKLTAGLRAELTTYPDVPEIKTHPLVAPLTFANGVKYDTGVLPDQRILWSPRFGFNYDVKGDRSLQFRGGTGIFTTKVPFVWIVAQSGDAGLIQFTQAYNGTANTPGVFSPNIRQYLPATPPSAGTSIPATLSAMDPSFRFPKTWKSSLAVDATLPWGITGTLEGLYNRELNIAKGIHVNLVAPTALNIAGYPDHRPIYPNANVDRYINKLTSTGQPSATATGAFNPIYLSNADEGHSWFITATLSKNFGRGLYATASYTRSEDRKLYDGQGDQLLNTWSLNNNSNTGNDPGLAPGLNSLPHRVIGSVSLRKEYVKNFATNISLFFEAAHQGRFSYTYSTDFNRDGQPNDLIYIPKDPSEITFVARNASGATPAYTAQQQSDAFFAYIEQDDYLRKNKGKYAERNAGIQPWRSQVDVRIAQEIFKDFGKTKNSVQFTLDILNFGNLLNSAWGNVNFTKSAGILIPTNVSALTPTGVRPTFQMNVFDNKLVDSSFGTTQSFLSTYYMQFGFRYSFQ